MKVRAAALVAVAACGAASQPASPTAPGAQPAPAAQGQPPVSRSVTIERDGFTLHATVIGDASKEPLLVALPGGPGLSADYLQPLAALATPTRAVVLLDPRGTGKSMAPSAQAWTLDDYNADLRAVLDQLGAKRAHLVGHSYSGVYVVAFAGAHPERVASLVMIDVIPATASELGGFFQKFIARLGELQQQGIVPAQLPEQGADCTEFMRAVAPVWYADPKHAGAKRVGNSTCRDVQPYTKQLAKFDLTAAASRYEGHALLVVPEQSPFGEMGTRIGATMTKAKIETTRLASCGHMPLDECRDQTLASIATFIAKR